MSLPLESGYGKREVTRDEMRDRDRGQCKSSSSAPAKLRASCVAAGFPDLPVFAACGLLLLALKRREARRPEALPPCWAEVGSLHPSGFPIVPAGQGPAPSSPVRYAVRAAGRLRLEAGRVRGEKGTLRWPFRFAADPPWPFGGQDTGKPAGCPAP